MLLGLAGVLDGFGRGGLPALQLLTVFPRVVLVVLWFDQLLLPVCRKRIARKGRTRWFEKKPIGWDASEVSVGGFDTSP